MHSRLLRHAALAGLLGVVVWPACSQDARTHLSFTAVPPGSTSDGSSPPPVDGSSPPPVDGSSPPPGDGSSPSGDGPRAGKTGGCGMEPTQFPPYTQYHLSVAGPDLDANKQPKVRDRIYFVRLPTTYDPNVAYRVVYLAPGCGGNTATEVIRLYTYSKDDAILVAMMPLPEFGGCFDETVDSSDYTFFDALHKKIEGSFCVDPARQFFAGFSTGARLGFMYDCAFSDVLRATATIQGALPPLPTCKDRPIAGFFVADTQETGNPYQSNVMAAERLLMQNGCTGKAMVPFNPMTTAATPPTTSCVKYSGCPADYPVVFCTTMGQGHKTFEPWSDEAFWNFFKSF